MAASLRYPSAQQGEGYQTLSDQCFPDQSKIFKSWVHFEPGKTTSGASRRMSFTCFFMVGIFSLFRWMRGGTPITHIFWEGAPPSGISHELWPGDPDRSPLVPWKKSGRSIRLLFFSPQKKPCPSRGPSAECLRVFDVWFRRSAPPSNAPSISRSFKGTVSLRQYFKIVKNWQRPRFETDSLQVLHPIERTTTSLPDRHHTCCEQGFLLDWSQFDFFHFHSSPTLSISSAIQFIPVLGLAHIPGTGLPAIPRIPFSKRCCFPSLMRRCSSGEATGKRSVLERFSWLRRKAGEAKTNETSEYKR